MKKSIVIGAITCFIIFLALLLSYKTNSINLFDTKMHNLFYGNKFIIFFHYFGETKVVAAITFVVILILILKQRAYKKVLLILSTVGGGTLLNQVIKNLVKRPRPEIPDQLSTYSFPSAHAMMSALLFLTLALLLTEKLLNRATKTLIWTIAIAFIVLIGLSRVAESRHFASDVLAGFCLAFTWFTICLNMYKKS